MSVTEPVVGRIEYRSSADGVAPLYAGIVYPPQQTNLPLVVLLHGFLEDAAQFLPVARRWASEHGVMVILPEMRGRGESAGEPDAGGVEVADILDAVEAVRERYTALVRANNVSLAGYGGGGANALSCAVRFPDAFRVLVAFCPVADYAAWFYTGADAKQKSVLLRDIGGTPQELPGAYLSRNAILASENNRQSLIMVFVDDDDRNCPPDQQGELWVARAETMGLENVELHISTPGDPVRWLYGNPETLHDSESLFMPRILEAKAIPPVLPQAGRLHIPGYIVTRGWECRLEDGRNGVAVVEYNLGTATGEPARWVIEPWTELWQLDVRLVLDLDRLPPSRRATPVRVLVNGRIVATRTGGRYELHLRLGDEIRLEQASGKPVSPQKPVGKVSRPERRAGKRRNPG